MDVKKYKFPTLKFGGGGVNLDELKDIPFPIKRVYYMYDTKSNVTRGKHAHKSLEQILICVCGSVKITIDNGYEKEVVLLDNPAEGLYIGKNMWHDMFDFSADATLLVLASDLYDENDYIRDYDEFLERINFIE